jgi:hypothetical protein
LSILLRISFLVFSGILFSGCTEDQSKAIGNIPKKTIDKAAADVNKAMQQGAERLEKKE